MADKGATPAIDAAMTGGREPKALRNAEASKPADKINQSLKLSNDPRREKPISIRWDGMIGQLTIDGESWGAIEWSPKRGGFCIEDAEGRCLRHKASIRGQAVAKADAIALARAMIRDGRMPSPEEAKRQYDERRQRERKRRAKQPSEIRRREQREERDRLRQACWEGPPVNRRINRADLARMVTDKNEQNEQMFANVARVPTHITNTPP
jgi:hypothetical protein